MTLTYRPDGANYIDDVYPQDGKTTAEFARRLLNNQRYLARLRGIGNSGVLVAIGGSWNIVPLMVGELLVGHAGIPSGLTPPQLPADQVYTLCSMNGIVEWAPQDVVLGPFDTFAFTTGGSV